MTGLNGERIEIQPVLRTLLARTYLATFTLGYRFGLEHFRLFGSEVETQLVRREV